MKNIFTACMLQSSWNIIDHKSIGQLKNLLIPVLPIILLPAGPVSLVFFSSVIFIFLLIFHSLLYRAPFEELLLLPTDNAYWQQHLKPQSVSTCRDGEL